MLLCRKCSLTSEVKVNRTFIPATIKFGLFRLSPRRTWRTSYFMSLVTSVLFYALVLGLIAGTYSMKREIEQGGGRPLNIDPPKYWVIQEGTRNTIQDSFIDPSLVDSLSESSSARMIGVTRSFRKMSFGSRSRPALLYSFTEALNAFKVEPGGRLPQEGEVVIDQKLAEGLHAKIGDRVQIVNTLLRVSGLTMNTSFIGNEGAFVDPQTMRATGATSLTAIMAWGDPGPLPAGLTKLTHSEFVLGNQQYWRDNGSSLAKILLDTYRQFGALLLLGIVLFTLAIRRKELATMRANGARIIQIMAIEAISSLGAAAIALAGMLPMGWYVVKLANQTPGFEAKLMAADVIQAYKFTLLVGGVMLALIVGIWCQLFMRHPAKVLARE